MPSTRSKLRLAGSFAVLAALALAMSCKGFFQNPVLTSIAINPTAPQVQVGAQLSPALQVFGTYDDGTRKQVKSGVSWSIQPTSVATVDPNSGVLTGVSVGTATITASAQALTATATATVFLSGVSSMTVNPTTGNITGAASQNFTFTAMANGVQVPITTDVGGNLTITPADANVSCAPVGNDEVCTADGNQTTVQILNVTMTYPGTNASATAVLTVNP